MRQEMQAAILGMYDAINRAAQAQAEIGHADQGRRSGITSGKHLDPVIALIREDLVNMGFNPDEIYDEKCTCTLPGWFRPTKSWDLLAFDHDDLISAIELKSISSSFSNNANNRAEESIGSAVDAAEAYNEHLLGESDIPPVMSYAIIVRDCEESRNASNIIRSPHYPIDPEFEDASYLDRFLLLCRRLRRKSLYHAVWLVFADPVAGTVIEPDPSMTYEMFVENISMGLRLHRRQRFLG